MASLPSAGDSDMDTAEMNAEPPPQLPVSEPTVEVPAVLKSESGAGELDQLPQPAEPMEEAPGEVGSEPAAGQEPEQPLAAGQPQQAPAAEQLEQQAAAADQLEQQTSLLPAPEPEPESLSADDHQQQQQQQPEDDPGAPVTGVERRSSAGRLGEEILPLEPPPPPPPTYQTSVNQDSVDLLNMVFSSPCPATSIVYPPSRLQLPLPRGGFMCDQCGDRFVLPSSLALHLARRSMEIYYRCPHCDKTRLFANKCQLLEHLDSHKVEPDTIDPTLVDVQALTVSDLCPPTKVIPTLDGRVLTGPPKLTKMGQVEKIDKPVYVSCPMCNVMCSTVSLGDHMCPPTDVDKLDSLPPRCPECAQPCPTECSLMAHHGLHKPDLWPYPYVCPECSVKILGSFEEYRRHVIVTCLHLTRDLKSCCSICLIEVGDVKAHMLQSHVQKLYKCRRCPLAFESINGFNSHVKGKHDGEAMMGDTPYMPILKCPFCAATFNNGKTLRDHMGSRKHGDKVLEQVKFVFRCPECEVDYGRKELLADHLAQTHPDFKVSSMELVLPQALLPHQAHTLGATVNMRGRPVKGLYEGGDDSPQRAADRKVAPSTAPRLLPSAPGLIPARQIKQEATPSPPRRPAVLHNCIVCTQVFRRKTEYLQHARAHLKDGVPLCLLCNRQFESLDLLKNHIADHASEIGRDRCGLCYLKLGSRDALQSHLEAEHKMRNFTCPQCKVKFERLIDLNRHNFAKHRGVKAGKEGAGEGGKEAPPAGGEDPDQPDSGEQEEEGEEPEDEDEDDDLPLSVSVQGAARKQRKTGTLANVTSLYDLDSETSSLLSDGESVDTSGSGGGRARKKRPADKQPGRGGAQKKPRPADSDGPPRLTRVPKRPQSPEPDEPAFVEQPLPQLPASGYRCVCCGLQTEQRAEFVAHIRQHRQGDQHQCPECGQCYATRPSLTKHLLLVHKLRQPPAELAEAEQEREQLRWEELTRDLQPGQCHVCRANCGDEAGLQQHLRTHGLSYLRAYQRALQRRCQAEVEQGQGETLEDIANFVHGAASAAPAPGIEVMEEDGEDEVIELEMKEGEITQKQLRKNVAPHGDSSDEEQEPEPETVAPEGTGQQEEPTESPEEPATNGHQEAAATDTTAEKPATVVKPEIDPGPGAGQVSQ